ncbi:MAG: O-antigen ligase family protein [Sedimentisphaerales bacterium]
MIIRGSNISAAVTQQPTVLGWRLPAAGFFVYSMIAIGAHIVDARGFLVIGGAVMFLCVCIAWCRGIMAVSVDKSVLLVFCILLLSIFATLYDPTTTVFHNLIKHIAICILYIFIFSMGLDPIYSTPFRTIFVFVLLFMGIVSFIVPGTSETDDVMRMSGFFVNANNLSLTMMTLLFLINEEKDSRAKKFSIHAILVLFLLLSGTSGAILAYLGTMLFKYFVLLKSSHRYRNKWILVLIGIALVMLGCMLTTNLFMDVPIVNRIVTQLSLVRHELPLAASGYELDYGNLSSMYGTSDCSGIWRISHWRMCIDVIADANIVQLLCGYGIGASSLLLYKVPHNDYLRVMMEQGIIGLILYIVFFLTVFRRIDWRHRYCIVAIALYCFSENNMDNLLFMSIFAFFLASAQSKAPIHPATAPR